MAIVVRFPDHGRVNTLRHDPNGAGAIIIVLPVIRIEQYDDAVAPVMGRPMRHDRARKLRRYLTEDE